MIAALTVLRNFFARPPNRAKKFLRVVYRRPGWFHPKIKCSNHAIRRVPPLILMAALYGSSLACTANIPIVGRTITPTPTEMPTVTETPTVTQTSTPSMTPTARATALVIDWPLVINETFTDNRNGWMTGDYSDPVVKGTIKVDGGKYVVNMTPNESIYWWVTPGLPSFKDSFVSVDSKKNTISPNAEYGIVFRVSDNFGYFVSINALHQMYHFVMLYKNGWTNLTEWTFSPE
ncbi:MAG: hypothetical protein WBM17_10085, partial [Anaerolineales bacterium]